MDIFTNALANMEVVQKLLEERLHTWAKAYDIAHRYETTRQAYRTVTQLMQLGLRSSVQQRARATTVHKDNIGLTGGEPGGVVIISSDPP